MGRANGAVWMAVMLACASSSVQAVELSELEDGSVAKLTGLGNIEMSQGRFETAIARYQQALEIDRTYFTALYNLGLVHQQLGQDDKARQWYTEALRLSPDHPEVQCNLGVLAYRAGDFRGAADRFTGAARNHGIAATDVADYWFNAGTALERLGDAAAAVRAYDECLATDGRHFGGHYNLGTLHLIAGVADPARLRLATSHLLAATEIQPGRVEAWLNLALAQERTQSADPELAYTAATKAAAGSAAMNRVRWQRAQWLDRRLPAQKVAMRDELRLILGDDPNFPDANGMLGAYLYDIADFDGAITHLNREVRGEEPADPSRLRLEAHFLLAVIFTDHRPDPVKALAHAQAYYTHRPDAAKIHELRRRALRLSGAMGVAAAAPTAAPAVTTKTAAASHTVPVSAPEPTAGPHGSAGESHEAKPSATHAAPAGHH